MQSTKKERKKAFDTGYHKILLKELRNYGIGEIANGWFKSCLKNRMQYGPGQEWNMIVPPCTHTRLI